MGEGEPTKKGTQARGTAAAPTVARTRRFGLAAFCVLLVGLFIGFAIAQGIGGPSVPSGDVALVEGLPDGEDTVSESELKRGILQQAAQNEVKGIPEPGDDKYGELKESALGERLDALWLRGEAEELGIEVTQKQIESELRQIKDQQFKSEAEFEKFLKTSRLNQEDVFDRVKLQILSTQIQERITELAPSATDAEIESFYKAELEAEFTQHESRDARLIVHEDEAKVEAAKAQLEKDSSPENWKKIAAKVSEDPNTKTKGGLQDGLSRELLQSQPDLEAAVFDNDVSEIVGPVFVAGKYFLTEVVRLTPAESQSLLEVRSQIKAQLDQEIQQTFFAEFVADFQSKWESRTFCADGFMVEKCSNYVGDGHPSTAPTACYEADPKGGIPRDCPAPVQQSTPAFPGSVTERNREGDRLPQRPRPSALKELSENESGLPSAADPPPIAE